MPTAGNQKTLHQRNKSSPALSTMLNAGGFKQAAKRTAFGDVSNNISISRPSKDDSAISGKSDFSKLEKPIPIQPDKKTISLLRPAQRPTSVSTSKTLVTYPPASNQSQTKEPLQEVQQPLQAYHALNNTRKVAAKKSTAIFKDIAHGQHDPPQLDSQIPSTSVASVAQTHRELPTKESGTAVVNVQEAQPRLTRSRSKHLYEHQPPEEPLAAKPKASSSGDSETLRSDGIYVDEQGRVQSYEYVDPVDLPEVIPAEKEVVSFRQLSNHSEINIDQKPEKAPLDKSQPTRKSTLTTVSEPEEYWDDEGEENYDEDGYVTARSFKSRGENTTGGATTVLFPKVNLKAKKEIAAAKDLIEGSKTAEEIEDEAWDTTMVAEYGEDIFQYMKDLEVRRS